MLRQRHGAISEGVPQEPEPAPAAISEGVPQESEPEPPAVHEGDSTDSTPVRAEAAALPRRLTVGGAPAQPHLASNAVQGVGQALETVVAAPFEIVDNAATKFVDGARQEGLLGGIKGAVEGAADAPGMAAKAVISGSGRLAHGIGETVTDAIDLLLPEAFLPLPPQHRMRALLSVDHRGMSKLVVSVGGAEKNRVDGEVYYRISVTAGTDSWEVGRRYSEFDDLHRGISEVLAIQDRRLLSAQLRDLLPPKSDAGEVAAKVAGEVFSVLKNLVVSEPASEESAAATALEHRRAGLDAYLKAVCRELATETGFVEHSRLSWFLVPENSKLLPGAETVHVTGRCSWCLRSTYHSVKTGNSVQRSIYTCTGSGCGKDTLLCKKCCKATKALYRSCDSGGDTAEPGELPHVYQIFPFGLPGSGECAATGCAKEQTQTYCSRCLLCEHCARTSGEACSAQRRGAARGDKEDDAPEPGPEPEPAEDSRPQAGQRREMGMAKDKSLLADGKIWSHDDCAICSGAIAAWPVRGATCRCGCGRSITPGRTPRGNPWDTCCRECADAHKATPDAILDPEKHGRECTERQQAQLNSAEPSVRLTSGIFRIDDHVIDDHLQKIVDRMISRLSVSAPAGAAAVAGEPGAQSDEVEPGHTWQQFWKDSGEYEHNLLLGASVVGVVATRPGLPMACAVLTLIAASIKPLKAAANAAGLTSGAEQVLQDMSDELRRDLSAPGTQEATMAVMGQENHAPELEELVRRMVAEQLAAQPASEPEPEPEPPEPEPEPEPEPPEPEPAGATRVASVPSPSENLDLPEFLALLEPEQTQQLEERVRASWATMRLLFKPAAPRTAAEEALFSQEVRAVMDEFLLEEEDVQEMFDYLKG
jgi:hypothetical protein